MRILLIGAHPDDIELSMSMTVQKLIADGNEVFVYILSRGGRKGKQIEEIRMAECKKAGQILGITNYSFGTAKDSAFYEERVQIRSELEKLIEQIKPTTVYTHYPEDNHIDHQITSEEVTIAARSVRNLIYFQSPYSKNFTPNLLTIGNKAEMDVRIKALKCFKSQRFVDNDLYLYLPKYRYLEYVHPSLALSLIEEHKDVYAELFFQARRLY